MRGKVHPLSESFEKLLNRNTAAVQLLDISSLTVLLCKTSCSEDTSSTFSVPQKPTVKIVASKSVRSSEKENASQLFSESGTLQP